MKAIMKTEKAEGFALCDVAEPTLNNSTDVKLKVLKSSVCGTDYHIYSWDNWSQKTINTPQINGHEVLAEIVVDWMVWICNLGWGQSKAPED